jgi:phosphotransacetylase
MTITLELPKETEEKIRKRAKRRGQDINTFVLSLVEREVLPSWAELVKPIHDETKRLGLTEEDVEKLVDEELAEVRKIRRLSSR